MAGASRRPRATLPITGSPSSDAWRGPCGRPISERVALSDAPQKVEEARGRTARLGDPTLLVGPPDSGWQVEPPVASVELPTGFPGDVPRYPDARIARAAATDEGFAATFVTSEDVDDAAEEYEDRLDDEGWITKLKAGEEEKLIVATKQTQTLTLIPTIKLTLTITLTQNRNLCTAILTQPYPPTPNINNLTLPPLHLCQ